MISIYSIDAKLISIIYIIIYFLKNILLYIFKNKKTFVVSNFLFHLYIATLIFVIGKYIEIPIGGTTFPPNFVPFIDLFEMQNFNIKFFVIIILKNYLGNILIFIPLGFFLINNYKITKINKIIIIGFLTSLVFESLQLIGFFSYSMFDTTDLILNTIGCVLGFFIFNLKKYVN